MSSVALLRAGGKRETRDAPAAVATINVHDVDSPSLKVPRPLQLPFLHALLALSLTLCGVLLLVLFNRSMVLHQPCEPPEFVSRLAPLSSSIALICDG